MDGGNGTLHCGNYTRCNPNPRAETILGEKDEKGNGNVMMDGSIGGEWGGKGIFWELRGGTPGEAP